MLRRQARLRREYLYRKSVEEQKRSIADKKQRLKKSLDDMTPIPTDLQKDAIELQKQLKYDDEGGEGLTDHQDDEYRWAGVTDPKIMVTTSRDPSSRLKMFAKEIKLLLPNAQRLNRGGYEINEMVKACVANEVTDLILLHETRGEPDQIVVSHLPYGPTAFFSVTNTVMRHDIPDVGPMSEAYPHLIFHNFITKLGKRTMSVLKHLFPVPKDDSRRIVTFANEKDYISFRHHTYKLSEGRHIELKEAGPRFELKLYKLILGTVDQEDVADVEWVLRPYMNTSRKRHALSNQDAFPGVNNGADVIEEEN